MTRGLGIFIFVLLHIFAQAQYTANGNAVAQSATCYSVTPNAAWQNGTVWSNATKDLSQDFDISFSMNFGFQDGTGADGMVFVLQQQGVNAIGAVGSGMGYQGFTPSFGIEFDTFQNNNPNDPLNNSNDPVPDHIAFLKNGDVNHSTANNLAGPVNASSTSINIEDGINHTVRITWNATTHAIAVYFDCNLRLSSTVDIVGTIFSGNPVVYWGFTASTGAFFNGQTVCLPENIAGLTSPATICPGNAVTLNAPINAYNNVTWTPSNLVNDPYSTNVTAIVMETTTFTITYQDICGTSQSATVDVNVFPGPVVTVSSDTTFCQGQTIQLTGSIGGAYNSFAWATPDGAYVGSTNTLTPSIATSGNYFLTVLAANGCNYFDGIVANVIPMPTTSWADTVSFCNGASAVLDPQTNATSILWETGSMNPTITVNAGGWYNVGLSIQTCSLIDSIFANVVYPNNFSLGADQTICNGSSTQIVSSITGLWSTNANANQITVSTAGDYWQSGMYLGCAVSDTVHVFVQNPPVVNLGNDTTLCYGNSLMLDAGISGTWSTGATSSTINVTNAGNYTFNYNDGVCATTDAVQVSLAYAPVEVLPDSLTACSTSPLVLDASTSGANSFLWSTGETTNSIVAETSGPITLAATNQCGSTNEIIEITYEDCNFSLYIPNTFTPNEDGDNDVWYPVFDRINRLDIRIFDRWGTEVFHGDLSNFYWVGDVRNGKNYAEDGTYVYRITYSSDFGDDSEVNGHIILFR